jgi:hypothetical protein
MKNIKYLIIVITFPLFSCNSGNVIINVEESISFNSTNSTPFIFKDIKEPKMIGEIDGHLIIINKSQNPWIQIVSLEENKIVSEIGNKNDYLNLKNPYYFNRNIYFEGEHCFEVVDFQLHKIYYFSLKKAINGENSVVKIINLSLKLVKNYNSILTLDDKTFWGTYSGVSKKYGRMFLFDSNEDSFEWISYKPIVNLNFLKSDIPYIYYCYPSFNSKRGLIAVANRFYKRVEFFNGNNLIISSEFKDSKPFKYVPNIMQNVNITTYYNASFAGNKYFYALCINKKQIDYVNNVGNIGLHVFNWDGTLKKIIKLDRMYLGYFAVNESTNKLYAISYVKGDSPILIYDLKI